MDEQIVEEPIIDELLQPFPKPIPDDLKQEIIQLETEDVIEDAKQRKQQLQQSIEQKRFVPIPVPEWKHFKHIQKLWLKLKHADKWQASDWVSLIIFIIGSTTIISQYAIGNVTVETAASLNIALGVLSQIGSTLANKFSVTNTIPTSKYTYSVNEITGQTSTTSNVVTETSDLPVDDEGMC